MWGIKVVRSEMILLWLKDLKCCIFTCGGQSNNGQSNNVKTMT